MEFYPSGLKVGDFIFFTIHDYTGHGTVTEVMENGCFVTPETEHGIRKLERIKWLPDDATFIEEINGESMF